MSNIKYRKVRELANDDEWVWKYC